MLDGVLPIMVLDKTLILFVDTFTVTSYHHPSLALATLIGQAWLQILDMSNNNIKQMKKQNIFNVGTLTRQRLSEPS